MACWISKVDRGTESGPNDRYRHLRAGHGDPDRISGVVWALATLNNPTTANTQQTARSRLRQTSSCFVMPDTVRFTLIALSLAFVLAGGYYRMQSQRSGERLDRTKEGWPILIGLRLAGLSTLGSITAWFYKPDWFSWATLPVSIGVRWIGVTGFAFAICWLMWMFHALGRNLTDTVVTRRDAYFVDSGPYRFVRNPMYTGVLMAGLSLGLALGTWLIPLATSLVFTLFALRTRTEEKYLIERFGQQYREYIARAGRFFPKLRA